MNCCFPFSAKKISDSTFDAEFKIPNNSNGCESAMTDVISNFKGVETCDMDTENQTIAVTGSFNLEKLLKKLTKVTGKEVEIVKKEEKDAEPEIVETVQEEEKEVVENDEKPEKDAKREEDAKPEEDAEPVEVMEPNSDEYKDLEKWMMFSDENPNAKCTIS